MTMKNTFSRRKDRFQNCFSSTLSCLNHSIRILYSSFFHVVFGVNPFWIQLAYFMIISFFGCIALKITMPKKSLFIPKFLDLFFMSTSASTVSSMGTVEMEVFSNTQLIIMTVLMFVGGEVFVSLLGLQFMKLKFNQNQENRVESVSSSGNSLHQIELGRITHQESDIQTPNSSIDCEELKNKAIRILGFVVLTYLIMVHIFGTCFIALYIYTFDSAKNVLDMKRISIITFSIFTTTSSFSNCGFIPTNENMVVFKKNTGLLLVLIPQILLGNTLYPLCLRIFIEYFLERFTKRWEFSYILKNYKELGYNSLFSRKKSCFLGASVLGFILIMVVGFCIMEWNSNVMEGLNSYEKIVCALFLAVNSRHAGESVFDLSIVTPAMLVLYVFMMYLPPYTYFSPVDDEDDDVISTFKKKKRKSKILEKLILSKISYLVIFTILICITERKKLREDPLNFTVMNIIFEVISAYGNVGFSIGYSCQKNLKATEYCKDKNYGFVGRWSGKGKLILIVVMFFGRLKKFGLKGGRTWKLS